MCFHFDTCRLSHPRPEWIWLDLVGIHPGVDFDIQHPILLLLVKYISCCFSVWETIMSHVYLVAVAGHLYFDAHATQPEQVSGVSTLIPGIFALLRFHVRGVW